MVTQTEINKLIAQFKKKGKHPAISHILSLFAIKSGNQINKPYQDTIMYLMIYTIENDFEAHWASETAFYISLCLNNQPYDF